MEEISQYVKSGPVHHEDEDTGFYAIGDSEGYILVNAAEAEVLISRLRHWLKDQLDKQAELDKKAEGVDGDLFSSSGC